MDKIFNWFILIFIIITTFLGGTIFGSTVLPIWQVQKHDCSEMCLREHTDVVYNYDFKLSNVVETYEYTYQEDSYSEDITDYFMVYDQPPHFLNEPIRISKTLFYLIIEGRRISMTDNDFKNEVDVTIWSTPTYYYETTFFINP